MRWQHLIASARISTAKTCWKAGSRAPGFPARTISDAYEALPAADRRTIRHRAAKAVGLLISVGSGPIRLVSIITLTSSILSVLYACLLYTSDAADE